MWVTVKVVIFRQQSSIEVPHKVASEGLAGGEELGPVMIESR